MVDPYVSAAHTYFYSGLDYFKMGGTKYYNGFVMDYYLYDDHYEDDKKIIYNLQNKYSKMEFILGAEDGQDTADSSTVYVYADNELIKKYTRNQYDLPRKYTLNLKGVYKLEIIRTADTSIGFGDVKLYYR